MLTRALQRKFKVSLTLTVTSLGRAIILQLLACSCMYVCTSSLFSTHRLHIHCRQSILILQVPLYLLFLHLPLLPQCYWHLCLLLHLIKVTTILLHLPTPFKPLKQAHQTLYLRLEKFELEAHRKIHV